MSAGEPALRLVRTDTGESIPFTDGDTAALQQEIGRLNDVVRGLQRDVRGWAHRYAELKRDKEEEARQNPLWPQAIRLFRLYCRLSAPPDKPPRRLAWNAERFEEVYPYLKKHGIGMCERAVVGRVFDHYVSKRKNGSMKHHHDWSFIFANWDRFEESANRAPTPFVSSLEAEDEARALEAGAG